MTVVYTSQVNFNGGVLGASVVEREDVRPYANAVAESFNFQTNLQGNAVFRSGTKFISEVKDNSKKTRLIPFEFSTEQAYLIEAGDSYFRFYKNRAPVFSGTNRYEVAHVYNETTIFRVNHSQSADVLYLNTATQPEYKLTRTADTAWTFTKTVFDPPPFKDSNTTGITLTASAATGAGITITSSASFFSSLKIGAQYLIKEITGSKYNEWKPATAYVVGDTVRYESNVYRATSAATSGTRPPIHTEGNESDGVVSWDYLHNGEGRVEITAVSNATTAIGTVRSRLPDSALSPGTDFWTESLWNPGDGYPSASIFFGDRRWLSSAFRVDGTVVQEYDNFAVKSEENLVTDDSAVTAEINSNQVNKIAWLADDDKGLVLGTTGGEWLVSPSRQGEAITPRNRQAKRVGKNGCAEFIQSVGIDDATIFVQRNKRAIMALSYRYEQDKLTAEDLTLLAPELLYSGVVCMAYQRRPNSILWVVNNQGQLLGLTIKSSQDVRGWHVHEIGGFSDDAQTQSAVVEWVEVLPSPDGDRDDVYVIVRRRINGATKRYIELLTDEWDDSKTLDDMRFVDSHIEYAGAPTTTIGGMGHLVGQSVTGVFDGTMVSDGFFTVNSSGQITNLPKMVSKAAIGLSYKGRLRTLPKPPPTREGSQGGRTKRVYRMVVSLLNSLAGRYGSGSTFYNFEYAKGTPMDVPQALFTGVKRVAVPDAFNTEGSVTIEQHLPFPMQIRAVRYLSSVNAP